MQPRERAMLGQLADVDLRLLRVFRAVADCGGMAAAELELNIAMSTISRHIKDLEERFGMVLCRRGRSGFALTPEGERIYAASERLLQATDAFRTELHDINRNLEGEIHVALFEKIATNPAARIDRAIAGFTTMAPQASIKLHVGTITSIERGVMDGSFHLGLIPEHRRSDSLVYDELFTEQMLLYAGIQHLWYGSAARKRDWSSLSKQQLAGLDYHSPNLELAHSRRLRRAASASDQEGVAHLVLSGTYLGFLPDHYAEPFVCSGRMRAISPDVLNYNCTFCAIGRRDPPPLRIAEAFRQCLIDAHVGR
jgi:LysR family transcriptional regulator, transcriptional activator for bauABCD operon